MANDFFEITDNYLFINKNLKKRVSKKFSKKFKPILHHYINQWENETKVKLSNPAPPDVIANRLERENALYPHFNSGILISSVYSDFEESFTASGKLQYHIKVGVDVPLPNRQRQYYTNLGLPTPKSGVKKAWFGWLDRVLRGENTEPISIRDFVTKATKKVGKVG
jgi:hypothetical protein